MNKSAYSAYMLVSRIKEILPLQAIFRLSVIQNMNQILISFFNIRTALKDYAKPVILLKLQ
jgi:hypothetical protein